MNALAYLEDQVRIVGIADPITMNSKSLLRCTEKAVLYFQRQNNIHYFHTMEELYEKVESDMTLVLTPPQYHSRYVILAIQNNNHVLVEKPVCTSIEQLKDLIRIDNEKGNLKFMVNQQYRRSHRWNYVMEHLRKIGNLSLVLSEFNQNDYEFRGWWRNQMEYISLFNWYVHHIDTMRYVLQNNPKEVRAKFIRPKHSAIRGYSSMLLNAKFSNDVEWIYTANQESKNSTETDRFGIHRFYGSDGYLHSHGHVVTDYEDYLKLFTGSMNEFIRSINENNDPDTSFTDNLWTIATLFASIESFKQDKTINMGKFMDGILKCQ